LYDEDVAEKWQYLEYSSKSQEASIFPNWWRQLANQVWKMDYKNFIKPLEKETKSIVAGPSFLQFLSKLFQVQ
jgi:hypothetical protein